MDKWPSYHDVIVYVNGKAHKISENYGYELLCTRTTGWRLYFRPASNWTGVVNTSKSNPVGANVSLPANPGRNELVLIGGEFDGSDFRIEVNGITVCASTPSGGGTDG